MGWSLMNEKDGKWQRGGGRTEVDPHAPSPAFSGTLLDTPYRPGQTSPP